MMEGARFLVRFVVLYMGINLIAFSPEVGLRNGVGALLLAFYVWMRDK